ncbi:MAG TPA: hypothetical protein VNE61_14015 [Ktedonobacteraceae bacterium]|nr:hypothetical protein [Ktedonobacteraceae bacterium]
MIARKSHSTYASSNREAAVAEAMRLLSQPALAQRWVCEVCGMVHTGSAPDACESCGARHTLTQQTATHRELNSRW